MRVSELVRGYGELRRTRGAGRHALNEEAVLTPIFHALNCGGWRGRQSEPRARRVDEVDEFRRDPLTAPIPIQAFAAAVVPTPALAPPAPRSLPPRSLPPRPLPPRGRRRAAHALVPDPARSDPAHEPRHESGRHHYRLETAGGRGR